MHSLLKREIETQPMRNICRKVCKWISVKYWAFVGFHKNMKIVIYM